MVFKNNNIANDIKNYNDDANNNAKNEVKCRNNSAKLFLLE